MVKALIRLGSRNYIKTNRLILPVIAFISYLGIAYSVGPQKVLSTFMIQAIFIFILMLIVTVTYCDSEHEVLEQLIFLKVSAADRNKIYYSKILTLTRMLFVFVSLATLYPAIRYYFLFHGLFDRNLRVSDLAVSFLVSLLLGLFGVALGLIFSRRLIPERKTQLVLLVLIAILSIVGGTIAVKVPILKLFTWVLPPIYEITHRIGRKEYVNAEGLIWIMIGLLYCILYLYFYIRYMKRAEITERS
ncbi:MAG TPA: hypothetical protein VHP81_02690 [Lachnospiraceae bacterium]|nr:hypothetical protein [Lachnospiraceae bacterium]